jgi:protein O-GlcNAc transferase
MNNCFQRPSPETPRVAGVAEQFAAALESHRAGRLREAERLYREIRAAHPEHVGSYHLGGVLAHQLGRDDAVGLISRAIEMEPDLIEAHNDLGVVLRARGRLAAAVASFQRAVYLDPGHGLAHYNLATALADLGRTEDAIEHHQRAIALMPSFAYAHNNLSRALAQLGRFKEAAEHGETASRLKPDFAAAYLNLGNALHGLRRLDEALAHYRRSLEIEPGLAVAHYNIGVVLRTQSRVAESRPSFERAIALKPDFLAAKFGLCMAQLPVFYRVEREVDEQRGAYRDCLTELCAGVAAAAPSNDLVESVGVHRPFYLPYQGYNDRELQAAYGSAASRIMAARFPPAPLAAPPRPGEPIRVGFVSGFFRYHSNWKIPIKGWLSQLDRRKFRLFGYHTAAERDAETDVAAGWCERFHQAPMSLERWRAAIRHDAPHVLIFPEVGMDPVATQLAASRLAPIQCNALGHPTTGGFPTLDYYLSSEAMEPPDAQDHYTERLVRLPNLSIYYEPETAVPGNRAEFGLRAQVPSFWCGQALYKYLPQFDQAFARIARAVGECQIVFIEFPGATHVTGAFRTRLQAAFAAVGLDWRAYCVVLPRLDRGQYFASMGCCDLVLDGIAWSGCNSVLESLAYDLPVVTLPSGLMRGRHAEAILRLMGVEETIARDMDDFVEIAARLARDAAWRAAVSARIAANKGRLYRDRSCVEALEDFLMQAVRASASGPADAARASGP